jgi:hypothetical protein
MTMTETTSEHVDIDALALGHLEGDARRTALAHVAACARCTVEYDERVRALRSFHEDGGFSAVEHDAILLAILPDVSLAAARTENFGEQRKRSRRRTAWRIGGATAAGLLAAAAAVAVVGHRGGDDGGFVARGEDDVPSELGPGVRLFCVTGAEARVLDGAAGERVGAHACARTSHLVLAVRVDEGKLARAHATFTDAAGVRQELVDVDVTGGSERLVECAPLDASTAGGAGSLEVTFTPHDSARSSSATGARVTKSLALTVEDR